MKSSKSTKRALLLSLISMLLCVAMLTGSTFAWFTDSVVSGNNKIVAGNLDVELYHSKNADLGNKVEPTTKLFTAADGGEVLWEPGVMVYENFTVKNVGSLALKFKMTVNASSFNTVTVNDVTKSLKDVLKVAILDHAFTGTREEANTLAFTSTIDGFVREGELPAVGDDAAKSKTYAIVIYWEPTENDNDYNLNNGKTSSDGEPLFIDIGVDLVATQHTVENDSFGNDYDKNAWLELNAIEKTDGTFEVDGEAYVKDGNEYVKVEQDPETGLYETVGGETSKNYVSDNGNMVEVEQSTTPGLYNEVVGEGEEAGKIFAQGSNGVVPVQESTIQNVYEEVVGEGEEASTLFLAGDSGITEIKENEKTGLYETVVEEGVNSTLYVKGDTELVEVQPTTETSSLYKEVGGETSRLYAKGFSGVVEVQADDTTEGLYTAVGDDSEKFVTTAAAIKAAAPQGGNVTVVENVQEVNTSTGYSQSPFLDISAAGTPSKIDLSDKVLSIDSATGKNGIKVNEGASATFSNGTITMNKGYGTSYGVVDAYHGELTLDNMTVTNEACDGVCVSAGSDHGKVTIKNSTITGSDSPHNPAIFCGSQSTVVIENSTIVGAIRAGSSSKVELRGGDYRNAIMCSENKDRIIIYSGLFSADPRIDLGTYKHGAKLAQGSSIEQNEDGTWTVTAG